MSFLARLVTLFGLVLLGHAYVPLERIDPLTLPHSELS